MGPKFEHKDCIGVLHLIQICQLLLQLCLHNRTSARSTTKPGASVTQKSTFIKKKWSMQITFKNCKLRYSYIRTISQLIVQYSPIMTIMENRSKSSYNTPICFQKPWMKQIMLRKITHKKMQHETEDIP